MALYFIPSKKKKKKKKKKTGKRTENLHMKVFIQVYNVPSIYYTTAERGIKLQM